MYEHLTGEQLEEIGRRRYEARRREMRNKAILVGVVLAILVTALSAMLAIE